MNKIKHGLINKHWSSAPDNDIVDILLKWTYSLSLTVVVFSVDLNAWTIFLVAFSQSSIPFGMCSGSVSSVGSRKGKLACPASWSMVPFHRSLWEESTD